MNRGLAWFVGLMVTVAVLLGVGVWWIGPSLARLAFLDERRAEAYAVLDLAQDPSPQAFLARYSNPLAELVRSEDGEVFDQYQLAHVFTGRISQEWQFLRLMKFAEATDLVQVLTSTPYRVLAEGLQETPTLKLGSFTVPRDDWRPVVVVWLVQSNQSLDPLGALIASALQSDARLVWDAEVDPIDTPTSWNRVVVLDFADQVRALDWLRSDATATERTLSQTRVEDLALLVFSQ
jgi:hypothetical protein